MKKGFNHFGNAGTSGRFYRDYSKRMPSLVICLFLFTAPIHAQEWGANNPIWHYEQDIYIPHYYNGYNKISVLGDTILAGETAWIFLHEFIANPDVAPHPYYNIMKSANQKVYLYISDLEEFKLLYDFNAEAGDTFKIWANDNACDYIDSLDITIDSTSTILLNGVSLKVQYFKPVNYWGGYEFEGRIIEGIGWDKFLFPRNSVMDPPLGGDIRCFEDDVIGLYQFNENACDYIGIEDNQDLTYSIYPNPVTSTLHISAKEIPEVQIYSYSGQLLTTCHAHDIDFQAYPTGIYLLKISFNKTTIFEKVIKL